MSQALNKEIKFLQPGNYCIRVLGSVPEDLWDYFEGKTDLVSIDESGNTITTLRFHVRDQSELTGLINMLYNWRLVLLSVKID